MPSDAAMKVWREAVNTCDHDLAAAVIERAIAEAVEQERAKAEAMAEALRAVAAECCVPLGTDKQMYARWRKLATERVDIARAALKAWEATLPGQPE